MEYKELLEQYGYDYCAETHPDNCVYPMDELEELAFGEDASAYDGFERGLFAYAWNSHVADYQGHTEDFHLSDDYFAFDAYANLCSLTEYQLPIWYNQCIDKRYFIEWLIDNGYIEDESEITYDEPIGD